MRWGWKALAIGALLVAGSGAGCGPIEFEGGGAGTGSPCAIDEDCVPADCCGRSSRAVNLDEAPDCSGVQCNPRSCFGQAYGGCGLPWCGLDGFCQMAINDECEPVC